MRKLVIKVNREQNTHDGYCSDSVFFDNDAYKIEKDTEIIEFPIIYCEDYINSYLEDGKFIGGSNELKIYANKALHFSFDPKNRIKGICQYNFSNLCYKIRDFDEKALADCCGSGYCEGYLIRTLISAEVIDKVKKD